MKNSTKVGIIVCLAILLAFSLSAAFAANEKTTATKLVNKTNVTKGMTNMTKGMTNVTKGMTNMTKGMTNMTKGMTNVTKNTTNVTKNVVVVKR